MLLPQDISELPAFNDPEYFSLSYYHDLTILESCGSLSVGEFCKFFPRGVYGWTKTFSEIKESIDLCKDSYLREKLEEWIKNTEYELSS